MQLSLKTTPVSSDNCNPTLIFFPNFFSRSPPRCQDAENTGFCVMWGHQTAKIPPTTDTFKLSHSYSGSSCLLAAGSLPPFGDPRLDFLLPLCYVIFHVPTAAARAAACKYRLLSFSFDLENRPIPSGKIHVPAGLSAEGLWLWIFNEIDFGDESLSLQCWCCFRELTEESRTCAGGGGG